MEKRRGLTKDDYIFLLAKKRVNLFKHTHTQSTLSHYFIEKGEHFKYSKVKIYDLTKKELKYYTCFLCCHKKSPQINYHKLVVERNTTLLSCKFCRSEVLKWILTRLKSRCWQGYTPFRKL